MFRIYQADVKKEALALGFDLIGFTKPTIEQKYIDAMRSWLAAGNHAGMTYMEKIEQRVDLNRLLPGVKSVITLGMNYYYDQPPLRPDHGRIARYAYGRDYHKVIKKKLKKLCACLSRLDPTATHKPYVDTGPVLERALAEQAGLGYVAKNSLLITREYGSWVFLSEILTTLDLSSGRPENSNRLGSTNSKSVRPTSAQNGHAHNAFPKPFGVCGRCTKCIDACPTGAIIAPGVIDSHLCISYLTIESRDKIPPELAAKISETQRIFGCDICQEVCPHNLAKQRPHQNPDLKEPAIAADQIPLSGIPKTDPAYLAAFAGSPLMRPKRKGMERNIKVFAQSYEI